MSAELTISASIIENLFEDEFPAIDGVSFDTTGVERSKGTMTVASGSDTAIPLGPINGTIGWFIFINKSTTATVTIKTVSAGTSILTLPPYGVALGKFASGITAPVANGSASASMAYAIYEA